MVQAAVIRCVEVVGEAARHVSEPARKLAPAIPWQLIVGMRNVLVHEYGTVDLRSVYGVASKRIPELLVHLGELITVLEQETGWRET